MCAIERCGARVERSEKMVGELAVEIVTGVRLFADRGTDEELNVLSRLSCYRP